MREAPLTDRQRIVKGFVIGTLGLAVLFASPAVSLAERPQIPIVTYCGCTCWYSGAGGKTTSMQVTFTTDKSCSIYNRQTCYCDGQTCYPKYNAGARYKGELFGCKNTLPMKQAEPSANAPAGGVKPPVGAPGQGPAVR
jgi:hypothetical protein